MAGLTDVYENMVLDALAGGVAPTLVSTWYIGLLLSAPTEAGGSVVEPAGGNAYARVSVANNLTQWPAAVAGAKSNANPIIFPTATGAGWGTITYYGFFDASTGGNLRMFSALDTSRAVNAGDGFQFLAGDCKLGAD